MVLKKVIIILISISFTLNGLSQKQKNRINFSIGPSFGVGNFGDNNANNKYAGMAGTGLDFYAYYGYNVAEYVAIGIKGFVNSNKFDAQPTLDELNNSSHNTWDSPNSYWSASGILLGVTLNVPTSESFLIDFRLLGGYIHSGTPESYFYADNNYDNWIKMNRESAGTFGYNIGAGFTYLFNPKIGFTVNLDYISANFKYDDIVITSSSGSKEHTYEVEQSCTIINTTIGIVFVF